MVKKTQKKKTIHAVAVVDADKRSKPQYKKHHLKQVGVFLFKLNYFFSDAKTKSNEMIPVNSTKAPTTNIIIDRYQNSPPVTESAEAE